MASVQIDVVSLAMLILAVLGAAFGLWRYHAGALRDVHRRIDALAERHVTHAEFQSTIQRLDSRLTEIGRTVADSITGLQATLAAQHDRLTARIDAMLSRHNGDARRP